jgi:hypothetical protein
MTQQSQALESAFVEGYRRGMERAALREVQFTEAELTGVQDAAAHYVSSLAALGGTPAKQGEAKKPRYCQCKSLTNPCIVCGLPKFIDPQWLKRKIEKDGEEGEIGAGFELFSDLSALSQHPVAAEVQVKALHQIADEAKTANDVIRLNRDGRGQGRVRVATAMHRIAMWANTALSAAPPAKADGGVTEAGQFLIDRLSEFEHSLDGEDAFSEYHGHVAPALARFKAALQQDQRS